MGFTQEGNFLHEWDQWLLKNEQDCKLIQEDLNKIQDWSDKWLLKFNKEKCRVIHIGKKNCGSMNALGDSTLYRQQERRRTWASWWGVTWKQLIRWQQQQLQQIQCLEESTEHSPVLTCTPPPPALYKALVHPKMEFAIQASTKERHRQSWKGLKD